MRVASFEYCTIRYLRQAGVEPGDRIKLSLPDLTRLVRYTKKFFDGAPREASSVAKLSRSDQAVYNGFEVVLYDILCRSVINISFFAKINVRENQAILSIMLPALAMLNAWSRSYLNEMPKDLRIKIFSQKLSAQPGYFKFMAEHPGWQLEEVADISSSRYFNHRSVYKMVFRDTASGSLITYILKPSIEIGIISNKPQNEEFYSRYLDLFGRDPVRIQHFDGLNIIEYVQGVPSRELFDGTGLNPTYAWLAEKLIQWLAQEAALADAVGKGDRDLGIKGGGVWGNFILVPDGVEKHLARIVSIDHEYVFNRTDCFTFESAEGGALEMDYLAAFRDFGDLSKRKELFDEFKMAYKAMRERIIFRREEVKTLIGNYYKDEELQIFEKNIRQDPDKWLEMLFKKVELFWDKQVKI